MVVELVPLDGRTSERPTNLLSYLGETGELRAAAAGRRPAMGMRQVEQNSADEAATMYDRHSDALADEEASSATDQDSEPAGGDS
jgi:hypothetical protein